MIAAVVVTHSAPDALLARCVQSLRAAGGVDRVIVVDNGGRDVELDDSVELLRVPNRGYGAAANEGIRRALDSGATAVALLNDDIAVRPGWLEPLVDALSAGVGAVQPKLVVADITPVRINSLGVEIGRDGAGVDIGDGELDTEPGPPTAIERFTGGAVLFEPEFLRATGGFDERFFLYYEDADLGARGAALGWRYLVVPASVVEHTRGASTATNPGRTRYLQERNRLAHAVRHCDAGTVGRAFWLSVRRLRHAPRFVHARALLAGLAAAPGALWRRARHADAIGPLRDASVGCRA